MDDWDGEAEEVVYQEDETDEVEAFASFLRYLVDHCGPSTSRYSPKRIFIRVEPWDKYELSDEADPASIAMSIYATLWHLRFPSTGDAYAGCAWVDVFAQGVPAHIGTPTPGYGYETGDPFDAFLPPVRRIGIDASEDDLRAVVFVVGRSKKGTVRSGQEYESPLLVLSGEEYAAIPFQDLHDRLCDALRGPGPRLVLQMLRPGLPPTLVFDDGSTAVVDDDEPPAAACAAKWNLASIGEAS